MSKTIYLGMIGDIIHSGLINIINESAKYGDVMIGLFTAKAIATHIKACMKSLRILISAKPIIRIFGVPMWFDRSDCRVCFC